MLGTLVSVQRAGLFIQYWPFTAACHMLVIYVTQMREPFN